MLKELKEKKYSFSDSNLSRMLDYLLKKRSFNFQSQKDLKRLGGRPTHYTTVIIGWSVTSLKSVSRLKSACCSMSKMG